MHIRTSFHAWVCVLLALQAEACSSDEDPNGEESSSGDTRSSGGVQSASGGMVGSGAADAAGGAIGSGGAMMGTGGRGPGGTNTGGMSSGGAMAGSGGDSGACTPDPDCRPTPPSTGDFYEDCVTRINQFRACICLEPLARNTEGEECANQQAQYDFENDTYHGGIRAKICSPTNLNNAAQNECPDYPSVDSTIGLCNQQMFDEGLCEDFELCGHYINMMDERSTSVSCGYYETPAGDVWMVENFY